MVNTTHFLKKHRVRGDLCFNLSHDLKGSFSQDYHPHQTSQF